MRRRARTSGSAPPSRTTTASGLVPPRSTPMRSGRGAAITCSVYVRVLGDAALLEIAAGGRQQVGLDERVEVALQNAVDVADFVTGTEILHEAIGRQHVAPDLIAPADLRLGRLVRSGDILAPLDLLLVELRL